MLTLIIINEFENDDKLILVNELANTILVIFGQ